MNVFWNSYCMGGWDNWSIGEFLTRIVTPSQQTQESWHKQILQSRIPGMFKGSTEHCFAESLPQLIEMDALILPTTLQFSVPAIPKAMMEKALWYIDHQKTHVHAEKLPNNTIAYYFLRRDNNGGWKALTKVLMEKYYAAFNGKQDARIKSLDELADVCDALHYVQLATEPWMVCACEGNPTNHICDCKGFKGHGICSHVLTINHILGKFNVRYQLLTIGKRAAKQTNIGRPSKPAPALTREKAREPDSSDEEEERLLELGRQGK